MESGGAGVVIQGMRGGVFTKNPRAPEIGRTGVVERLRLLGCLGRLNDFGELGFQAAGLVLVDDTAFHRLVMRGHGGGCNGGGLLGITALDGGGSVFGKRFEAAPDGLVGLGAYCGFADVFLGGLGVGHARKFFTKGHVRGAPPVNVEFAVRVKIWDFQAVGLSVGTRA